MNPLLTTEIKNAVEVLASGGTILYPTDTIWGIGCDATNQKAVDKIYKIKRRMESKSLLMLVESPDRIFDYVEKVSPLFIDLIKSYDKPLTVIYQGAKNVAKGVAAEDNTIGIRVTKDEFCKELISAFGKAIVSTSANISGEPSAIRFQQISEKVKSQVDYVVKLYQNEIRLMRPSRIIRITETGDFEIVRE
ncbi:MAG: L-threonylcarbamoyladenylate synthase [Bacteroidales bacterium]|mgnify:FL=1|jgi:L-threonylcarbamoyladenylate synthase|nr:threonylcarbamoyl-AMP synthase [Bacteroidales bacterium]MDI9592634.1 L-threonylcarbamoyladenylate synthase [Bacteroidota bacterium]OQC37069.1 MAG: Threonylcarbamoyl-AMP synthase [Bacteroidetes bacterium ADurb.Bin041]MCO6467845.1 threonylcarbamoyl-AMP synthase [Bacteroidales bacterium]HNV49360.1 L-threonylcarbamoyladenylate synthase [Bacteroidales bacterium]